MTTFHIHRMFLEMWNGGLNLELIDIIRHKRRYLSRNNWSWDAMQRLYIRHLWRPVSSPFNIKLDCLITDPDVNYFAQ